VDAGVLIAAARGGSVQAARAMEILDDPEREFGASPFLRLEVIPQATFNKRQAELAFYDAFFSAVSKWATDLEGCYPWRRGHGRFAYRRGRRSRCG